MSPAVFWPGGFKFPKIWINNSRRQGRIWGCHGTSVPVPPPRWQIGEPLHLPLMRSWLIMQSVSISPLWCLQWCNAANSSLPLYGPLNSILNAAAADGLWGWMCWGPARSWSLPLWPFKSMEEERCGHADPCPLDIRTSLLFSSLHTSNNNTRSSGQKLQSRQLLVLPPSGSSIYSLQTQWFESLTVRGEGKKNQDD